MMRVRAAAAAALLALITPAVAHGDSCACGALDPPPDAYVNGPTASELTGLLVFGSIIAGAGHVLGITAARRTAQHNAAVDGIPVVGAVTALARNPDDRGAVPLLVLSAAAQTMGALIIAATATDLAAERRLQLELGVGPNRCSAAVTWRFR